MVLVMASVRVLEMDCMWILQGLLGCFLGLGSDRSVYEFAAVLAAAFCQGSDDEWDIEPYHGSCHRSCESLCDGFAAGGWHI